MIGVRVRRLKDPRLLRGKGSYVDDISLPGIVHAALIRSRYGHARIKRIDLAAVETAPDVIDAFTLTDGWAAPPTIPVLVGAPSLLPCSQYPLARDKVRYVGEPVAVVVAIDRAHAEEAAEFANIEYEPLPVIADCEAAQTADTQLLHDTVPGNLAARWTDKIGNVARAFASADRVTVRGFKSMKTTYATIKGFEVMRALRKGQAAIFNLRRDIGWRGAPGRARLRPRPLRVERSRPLGQSTARGRMSATTTARKSITRHSRKFATEPPAPGEARIGVDPLPQIGFERLKPPWPRFARAISRRLQAVFDVFAHRLAIAADPARDRRYA
jgi:Aldehyde oxidase and xanthine dehydrogenase, a/b hammerhead domain